MVAFFLTHSFIWIQPHQPHKLVVPFTFHIFLTISLTKIKLPLGSLSWFIRLSFLAQELFLCYANLNEYTDLREKRQWNFCIWHAKTMCEINVWRFVLCVLTQRSDHLVTTVLTAWARSEDAKTPRSISLVSGWLNGWLWMQFSEWLRQDTSQHDNDCLSICVWRGRFQSNLGKQADQVSCDLLQFKLTVKTHFFALPETRNSTN